MGKHITFMGGSMRLSLFAAASVAAIAGFAPAAALAANECGNPGDNGSAADVFACTGSIPSIVYSSDGALTLTLTNGPTVTTGGISVVGNNADAVTINRSDATAGGGDPQIANTSGVGISATTGTGALALALTDTDTGDTPISVTGTTYGVQLQSGATSGAALNLTFTNGSIIATGPTGIGVMSTTTSVAGGNHALNLGGAVSGATGVRAISSGTGTLQVTATAVSDTVVGGDIIGTNGAAARLTPGAGGTVTVGAGRTMWANNPTGGVVEFTNINATRNANTLINAPPINGGGSGGVLRSSDASISGYDDLVVLVMGGAGNSAVNNSGTLQGRVSLLNTGNATINNTSGLWHTAGASIFGEGSGVGTVSLGSTGRIMTNAGGAATSFAFGAGAADVINNNGGLLVVGEGPEAAATLVITGLETWNNAGPIRFGDNPDMNGEETDGATNDRITLSGAPTVFTGSVAIGTLGIIPSQLLMDVDLGGSQADCSAAVTADCLDLRGGSTAGETFITIATVGVGAGAERIVLVDLAGAGTSATGHFRLDPNLPNLINRGGAGGVLDGGLFLYDLSYDAAAKQHVLAPATIDREGLEFGLLGRAADVAWRTTTGSWLTRQADLRNALGEPGMGAGAWLKIAGNFVEDTPIQTYAFGPDMLDFDNSYSQRTSALVGGIDLVNVSTQDSAWLVGLTGGHVQSKMSFHESPTRVDFEGNSFGAYAGYASDALFVDAIVNAVKLDTEYSAPSAEIVGVTGEVESLGFQVEAGYRLSLGEGARLEPLATLVHVQSDLSDLGFANVGVSFDQVTSLRGAVGLRYAGELEMDAFTTQFSVTGRVWEEFEGENAATIATPGSSFLLLDDTADTLGEVAVALSLFSGGRFSANLGYGVRFKEEYLSTDASFAMRFNW